jgi:polysaccharide chain length determinant protein (PEP-CTERM system associated)
MSAEFRQRRPSEYLQLFWRRKWMIILPALALAAAIAVVVWRLPNVYESTALLIVQPPTIPNMVAPTSNDSGALSSRLDSMTQQVQSRSSLEPMIQKYNLYEKERKNGVPMETLVDVMRQHITVDIERGSEDRQAPSFRITYRGREAQSTRAVTAELSAQYVNAQIEDSRKTAEQTRKFFEAQLADAQKDLDGIDKRRLDLMNKNMERLPSTVQSLIAQLEGLREEQKSRITEIGRLSDNVVAMNRQINDLKSLTSDEDAMRIKQMTRPQNSPSYSEMLKQKTKLAGELQIMLTTLRPNNPDVIAKQTELAQVDQQIKDMLDEWNANVAEMTKSSSTRVDMRVSSIEIEKQRTEAEVERQKGMLASADGQIADLDSRINGVPEVQVALESIDQDYKTKKTLYDKLLEKKDEADRLAALNTQQQGELIKVVDAANLPTAPVAPKRLILMGVGLAAGLAFGIFLAGLFELPRLLTIQTVEDAAHYTNLPVLASVPELLTPLEVRRQPQKRLAALAAGVVVTVLSIPVLAIALTLSHVFDRFVS